MKDRYLISLGGGISQLPLAKEARRLGFKLIVIDQDKNAPCKDLATIFINKSTHQFSLFIKELKDIKENNINVIGIINRCSGVPVVTAAQIAHFFDIRALPIDSAISLVNKHLMRKICTKFDIPSPKYQIISQNSQRKNINISFPLIVKPSLSEVGKSGITYVESESKLEDAIRKAFEHSLNQTVLVEEYLSGDDYGLFGLISNKKLIKLCPLKEINNISDDNLIYGSAIKTIPPSEAKDVYEQVEKISEKLIAGLGLHHAPFLISLRKDEAGNMKLIEVHLDLGGELLIEELLPIVATQRIAELIIKFCSGEELKSFSAIKPGALIFQRGERLLNLRPFNIITSDTFSGLENKLERHGLL